MILNRIRYTDMPMVRDEIVGDMVGVNFDSYRDYRTGFEFTVTAWGQKVDLVLFNPIELGFQLECSMEMQSRDGRLRLGHRN